MAQTRPSPTLSRGFTRLGRFLAPYGVALTRAHVDQWKCDAETLARFVVQQLGLRRRTIPRILRLSPR